MRVFIAVGAFLLVSACQAPSPEMTEAEIAQIQSEVRALAEEWMDAWRANDCSPMRALAHPEFWTQPNGGRLDLTLEESIQACERTIANRASFSGNWTETEVRVISPDAAVFMGNWEGTFHYRDDTPPRYYAHSAQVFLVERTDTGWGLTFYVNSNDSPQPVTEDVSGG